MSKRSSKISALLILAVLLVMESLAAAQQSPVQAPTPPWYRPGPWYMWGDGYGWHFWWIPCLLMLLFIVVGCGAMYFLGRRDRSHGADRPHY